MAVSATRAVHYMRRGEKGETGPTLRGPQMWDALPEGYVFQCGAAGETYKDVVVYGGNYYSCVKSHAKTSANYPYGAADQAAGNWQLGEKIELVASQILLATYALVKNLGVECIDMRDAEGNIIFRAKDGAVKCNTGEFENVDIGSGNVGHFQIINGHLVAPVGASSKAESSVCCRNNSHNMLSAIGAGDYVSPNGSPREAARFTNSDNKPNRQDVSDPGATCNIALRAEASGAKYNHAIIGRGNCTLEGMVAGWRLCKATLTSTAATPAIKIEQGNRWIIRAATSGAGLALPTWAEAWNALGRPSVNTGFCLPLTIVADLGSQDFYLHGLGTDATLPSKGLYDPAGCPLITHWEGGSYAKTGVGQGAALDILLVYDPDRETVKMGAYSTVYTARIINRQSK